MSAPSRVSLQPAYLLHARPYRDTSQLLEVLTRDYGRLGLVARGARSARSAWRGVLQPFQPLLMSWSGRGELGTLTGAESVGPAGGLHGTLLFSGFYLNELLLRLLQRHDPHPQLFDCYATCLAQLPAGSAQRALRLFEKRLLEEVGYGLSLQCEADSGRPVQPELRYEFRFEHGPVPAAGVLDNEQCFAGSSLLSLHRDELHDEHSLRDAKRLMRAALAVHLGDRPLRTRELFARLAQTGATP